MAIWQKHWSNTASDPRMQLLLTEMGVRGYGIYWLISERLTACEQGAILQQHLVHDMRSRQLNSQYILQVINNYFLFETDEGGYVRHHRVLIGYMNAHTLHLLKTGQLSPALLDSAPNAQPTLIHRTANAQPNDTLYNARAGKNRTDSVFCSLQKTKELRAYKNRTSCFLHEAKMTQADKSCVSGFLHEAKMTQADKSSVSGFLHEAKMTQADKSCVSGFLHEAEEIRAGFEMLVNGRRYADGKPIPDEAPPRPSLTAVWDAGAHQWLEL